MFESWRHDNRIPLALIALMGFLLIVYLYGVAKDFRVASPSVLQPQTQYVQPLTSIGPLHLFGMYDDNLADLPPTQLALSLEGVLLSVSSQSQSFAIISVPNQPAKVYKIGDALPGGAVLSKILKNQVVIRYQGMLQSLKLPADQLFPSN